MTPLQIITAQASTNPELTLDMDTKASDCSWQIPWMQNAKNVLQGTSSCDAVAKCSRNSSWIHIEHLPIIQTTQTNGKTKPLINHTSSAETMMIIIPASFSSIHFPPKHHFFRTFQAKKNRQRNPGAFVERCLKLVPVFPFSASRTPHSRKPLATLSASKNECIILPKSWHQQLSTTIIIV